MQDFSSPLSSGAGLNSYIHVFQTGERILWVSGGAHTCAKKKRMEAYLRNFCQCLMVYWFRYKGNIFHVLKKTRKTKKTPKPNNKTNKHTKNPKQNNNNNSKNPNTTKNNLSLLERSWQYILPSFCSADTKEWMHTGKMAEVPLVRKKKPYGKHSFFCALSETTLFYEAVVSVHLVLRTFRVHTWSTHPCRVFWTGLAWWEKHT